MACEDTMNTQEETTNTTNTGASERPITFTDEPNAVTIRISGKAFANLCKIADTMNAASWTENDHTPAWAVRFWIGSFLDRLADTRETCVHENIGELTEDIFLNIDTGHEEGTPEDAARRDELRAAFEAAGV